MIGYLNFELWTGVEGEQVDDLRLDSRFPKQPTVSGCTVVEYVLCLRVLTIH